MSEVLCLGFPDRNGEVVLLNIDKRAPDGGRLYKGASRLIYDTLCMM